MDKQKRLKETQKSDKKNSNCKCKKCGTYLSGKGFGFFKCCNCGAEVSWGSDY